MKNIKKIVSIILIVMVTCIYVNTSFGMQVTEDDFYKTLKSFEKMIIRTEATNSTSSIVRTYEEQLVKNSNCISYYYPIDGDEDGNMVELFTTEYSINSNVFRAKSQVDIKKCEEYEKDEEKKEILYLGLMLMLANLPGDYIIALADLTGTKLENAYGYYVENIGTENETDPRGIIKYNLINNEKELYFNLEIDLEEFEKIDSTYLKGDTTYEIILDKKEISEDNKNENQVSDENETKEDVNNVANETNSQNENRNNSKNTNTNTNNNTNRNTNTNTTNTNRNVNKNVSNRPNNNTQKANNTNNKTDNTVSETNLPKAGIAKGGLVIIAISIIGIYSYKKYMDYNKMF